MESSKKIQLAVAVVCAVVLSVLILVAVLRSNVPTESSPVTGTNEDAQSNGASRNTEQPEDVPSIDNIVDENKTSSESKNDKSTSAKSYDFAAAAGDSYTGFAREAIDSYVASQNIKLTPSAALQAEVDLANAAGSPELEIGQKVTIAAAEISRALGQDTSSTQSSAASTDKSSVDASADYTYVAFAGDSYTRFARQAVDTYAANQELKLTPAQRIAAETYLTDQANTPFLEIGQSITIATGAVKSATDQAVNLSSDQQAAWQQYVYVAGI